MAPRFLNLGTRWRSVVCFTLRPLYPKIEFRYSLEWDLVGPGASLEVVAKRKIMPYRDSNPDSPTRAYEIYGLRYYQNKKENYLSCSVTS
jgi:hypothetical protein